MIPIFFVILNTKPAIMIQSNKEHFMKAALDEAYKAYEKQEVPVGAVVVCNDMIIARAHNLTETLNDPTAHAEMQAITAATNWLGGKYLTDCTIYVTLEPCAMCAGALGWSQVSGLVFGAKDEKKGFTTISDSLLHPKTKVESGILEKECREILKKFFKSRR
jgi:tRNA(adenine34) deaminase